VIISSLNDICELLGVDLGYRPEKITIHVYQGANEAGHQWNSLKYLIKHRGCRKTPWVWGRISPVR
jgi:hypothetical protein